MKKRNPAAPIPVTISTVEDSAPLISAEQLVTKDPVFGLLHDKLGIKLAIVLTLICAGVVFVNDVLAKEGAQRLLEALTSIRKLVLVLFAFAVYFLLPHWIADLFNGLKKNKVIAKSRAADYDYGDFQNDLIRAIDRRVFSIAGLAFLGVFWLRRVVAWSGKRSVWLEVLALLAVYAVPYYLYLVALIKLCVALFQTKRLFDLFEVKVSPLHPDEAGGFKPIGRTLLRYAVTLAVFVSLATAGRVLSYHNHQLQFIPSRSEVYMAVAAFALFPIFLWGWLWIPHKAMMRYRNGKLAKLEGELQRAGPHKEAERLSDLKKQYELTMETYPTWPMSFRQLPKFFGLIIVPFITTLITLATQYFWGRLTK